MPISSADKLRNTTLKENKNFIINIIEEICSKNVNWNKDPEVSIGLLALNHCISTHEESLGNFNIYAKSYIKSALIAYLIDNSYELFLYKNYSFLDNDIKTLSIVELEIFNNSLQKDVMSLTKALKRYRINYKRIMGGFPKELDKRNTILKIACYCVQSTKLSDFIIKKKVLPYYHISKKFDFPKDMLYFYEKYIISLFVIFSSTDYIYIKSYLGIKAGAYDD